MGEQARRTWDQRARRFLKVLDSGGRTAAQEYRGRFWGKEGKFDKAVARVRLEPPPVRNILLSRRRKAARRA